ncbi:MAG: hypothetical protein HY235_20335 [Acidobacteria bacterium]|nr:hypothetical protein [Acidobacteriota bacterium]
MQVTNAPAPWYADSGPLAAIEGVQQSSRSQTSLRLTLTTEDGDRVTLSADVTSASESFDYASIVRAQGQAAVEASGRTTESSIQVALNVEGDLSQQERADIRKLAALLARSAHEAERGHLSQALRTAARFTELDSIAAFNFSYERQVEHAQRAYQQIAQLN